MTYSLKPEKHEIREARQIVEGTLTTAETMLEKEADFEIGLSWSSRFEPAVLNPEKVSLRFNTQDDNWKDRLKQITAQGYAHSWFLENIEPELHWQEVLMLGHSLNFAEQATGQKPSLNDRSEVSQRWSNLKQELSRPAEEMEPEMMRYGFSAAYYIAEQLQKNHDLEEFPDLKRSDVIVAGDEAFSG